MAAALPIICDMPNHGMRASPLTALFISAGLFLVLVSSSAHHDSSIKPAQSGDASLAFYAELVRETELRRRVNVLFPNPQSLFDGMQVGYVGVRHGNLTFRRRDLVAGTNPLAKFTRVYDSRFRRGRDFGPGWHLSLNEELTVADEGLVYRDGSGATHSFKRASSGAGLGSGALPEELGMLAVSGEHPSIGVFPAAGTYTAFPSTPQHESTSIEVARSIAVLHTQGEMRVFERIMGNAQTPNSYRLSQVFSGERQIFLSRRKGLIDKVSDGDGVLFSVSRDARGRIASVQDRWGRQTHYRYDAAGRLQDVRDVAGNAWTYDYGAHGTLIRAVGPNDQDILRIRYDGAGRVVESLSGRKYSFAYAEGETVVTEGTGHSHLFGHNAAGITERFESTNGLWWRLTLDGLNRVTEVRSSRGAYKYSYAPTGFIDSIEERSAVGHTFRLFTHDSLGRITGVYSDQGELAEVDYSGGLTRITESATQLEFDLLPSGRVAFAGRDGTFISADYDGHGNLIALHNGGELVELGRDAMGRLSHVRYASGEVNRYQYDGLGNRAAVAIGRGGATRYAHDPAGNITEVVVAEADGGEKRQTVEIGDMNRVDRIIYEGAGTLGISYDRMGRAIHFDMGIEAVAVEYEGPSKVARIAGVHSGATWWPEENEAKAQSKQGKNGFSP